MIPHWSWWAGGLALAALPIAHWLLLHRNLAVSGRYTALIERLRPSSPEDDDAEMSADEMVAALRRAAAEEFGEEALEPEPASTAASPPALRRPQSSSTHLLFLLAIGLGGLLSAAQTGAFDVVWGLRGEEAEAVFAGLLLPRGAWLAIGGLLVGFGTRMAAGCTSGHGLCGVSRFQPGSLVATAAFFASAVAVSFALEAL